MRDRSTAIVTRPPTATGLRGTSDLPSPVLDYHGGCSLLMASMGGLMVRDLAAGDKVETPRESRHDR